MFCLLRHPPIIAPIGVQRQALLTERLRFCGGLTRKHTRTHLTADRGPPCSCARRLRCLICLDGGAGESAPRRGRCSWLAAQAVDWVMARFSARRSVIASSRRRCSANIPPVNRRSISRRARRVDQARGQSFARMRPALTVVPSTSSTTRRGARRRISRTRRRSRWAPNASPPSW